MSVKMPFQDKVWTRARKLAKEYRIVLEADGQQGFIGTSVELPGVLAEGPTADECVTSTREALALAVGTMIEEGRRPPSPARQHVRQAQVNVRLTTEEKFALEETARRMGFKGISDFIRMAALERVTAA